MRNWLEETLALPLRTATLEQVRSDIERDKILTAAQAVEYGLVDQVLEQPQGRDRSQPSGRPSAAPGSSSADTRGPSGADSR